MSVPTRTLSRMDELGDENSLRDWLYSERINIREKVLPAGVWGLYDWERQTIWIRAGLPSTYRHAALLHETYHFVRGDRGHQTQAVENQINEIVALTLVNPAEYRWAESLVGPSVPGLAVELEVPKWVVRAYRRILMRAA